MGDGMNKYLELKDKHQKELNDFPFFFAFSDKQFAEGMAKFGLSENDTDKIYKLGDTGGFYLRKDAPRLHEMFTRHEAERVEAMKDDEYLYLGLLYELANHEFIITYDPEPALDALGLTLEDLEDERIARIYKKAKTDYLKNYDNV